MSSSIWRRLVQFRLRTLLVGLTLLILAGNGFLIWWRTPFFIERRTTSSSWEHVPIVQYLEREAWLKEFSNAQRAGDLRRVAMLQASPPPTPRILFREKYRVYRNLSGERIRHGPYEIYDDKGALLRVENWSHGSLHGPWKDWLPDGREVCWGHYENGEKHGQCVTLDPNGKWRQQTEYSHGIKRLHERYIGGQLVGRTRYDETGSPREVTRWDIGPYQSTLSLRTTFSTDRDGADLIAYEGSWPNGQVSFHGRTRNGFEVGEWVFWNEDGSLDGRFAFSDGRLMNHEGALSPPLLPSDASRSGGRIVLALQDECRVRRNTFSVEGFAGCIADFYEIPFCADLRALRDAGVSPDLAISLNSPRGLPLRAMLQITLRDVGLTPVIRRDVLVITTPEDAARWSDETGLPEILRGRETALRRSLESIAKLRFKEAPLSDVLASLREKNQLPVRLDGASFPDANSVLRTPITIDLAGITMAQGLGFVLDDCGLRAVEANGELVLVPR